MHAGGLAGADLFGADRGIGVPRGAPPASLLPAGTDQLDRAATATEARAAAREAADRDTDLIKLWVGGPASKSLSREQRQLDQDARLTISHELGHERPGIVKTYIG